MYTLILSLILLFSSSLVKAEAPGIAPFTSDYCSSWFEGNWAECCFTHDLSYWMGGTKEDRLAADLQLNKCVHKKSAFQGFIMYYGVRIGGRPNYNTSYRWGYGWPKGRGYKALSSRELESVVDELNRTRFEKEEQSLVIDFMKKRKWN